MEFLEGQTLKHHIAGRPLPTDEVLRLGLQMAEALEVAHAKAIVHRDLKPANVFVNQRGQVKLLDFGLAKLLSTAEDATATKSMTESQAGRGDPLTPYERRIIELVRRRLSNREIGSILRINEALVKFHLSNIFAKLGVSDRQAVADLPDTRTKPALLSGESK